MKPSATRYAKPASKNTGTYDPVLCKMYPTVFAMNIPLTVPRSVANPTTDATADFDVASHDFARHPEAEVGFIARPHFAERLAAVSFLS